MLTYSKGFSTQFFPTIKPRCHIPIRALHSELLSEVSSRVLSRNEFSRVGTSSEKARKTRSDPNFRKTANKNFGKNCLTQGLNSYYSCVHHNLVHFELLASAMVNKVSSSKM